MVQPEYATAPHCPFNHALDLNPTPMIAMERCDLAMVCGRVGRYANRKNLLVQHGRFLLSEEDAAAFLDHIVETVRNVWPPDLMGILAVYFHSAVVL